ncbi:MAG: FAD-binding protein [Acidimicrobiales bacterium]|nr:FAD-binding protein [Acidimicrobiales bacterium]
MSPEPDLDLLIIGSGVAGLSAAVRAASADRGMRVGVLTKGELSDSATQWAQGGVAAVLHHSEAEGRHGGGPGDSLELHATDTMRAGAGLCDPAAVDILVSEGPKRVRELAELGAVFDRTHAGKLELGREGGHSTARVVHAGGAATGAEVERALVEAARSSAARIWESWFAADLVVEGGRCRGVRAVDPTGRTVELRARHTLLAAGGSGQLYSVTTNPAQCTGDGVAMALRAGVPVADVEFVQFHPTALHGPAGRAPRPLLSEALRGEGALLRDAAGQRFVDELQPRDVVAAAVAARIRASELEHVWLDVSGVEDFERRFPTLTGSVRAAGLDPVREWLPVAPAAHYMCGGVLTDLEGATALSGLWAAGEVACSGVHGANRLASNSLLDGMVFAARAVEAMLSDKDEPDPTGALGPLLERGGVSPGGTALVRLSMPTRPVRQPGDETVDAVKVRGALQRAMTDGAGVVRTARSLDGAKAELDLLVAQGWPAGEEGNLVELAYAVIAAATARTESRGGHHRADYPRHDPALAHRFVF